MQVYFTYEYARIDLQKKSREREFECVIGNGNGMMIAMREKSRVDVGARRCGSELQDVRVPELGSTDGGPSRTVLKPPT